MTLPVREVVAEPAPAAVTVPALPEPAPAPVKVAPAPRTAPTGLFRFPALTEAGEVVIKPDTAQHLDLLWGMHTAGKRQVIALVGPTGTGKTSLAYRLAARHGVGVMVFDAAGAREFSDWVGTTHLRDGRTEFLPSGFLTAIDADGPFGGQPRIVVIDEVNRAESSGALNALIPVLHGFGSLYVPEMGRSVNVDPTVMVVLTANRGTAYAGTVGMDLALQDRVTAWLRLDYLEEKDERALLMSRTGIDEAQATRLTAAAVRIRDAAGRGEVVEGGGISTRRLILAGEKVAAGFTLHAAATLSWLESYTDESGERAVVQSAIDAVLRGHRRGRGSRPSTVWIGR